jgi:hypothetical protein
MRWAGYRAYSMSDCQRSPPVRLSTSIVAAGILRTLLSANSCPQTLVPKLLSPNSCPQTSVLTLLSPELLSQTPVPKSLEVDLPN